MSKVPLTLRRSEWLILIYFSYVAIAAWAFRLPQRYTGGPALVVVGAGLFTLCAWAGRRWSPYAFSIVRDWLALAFLLTCYRQMDWFSPETRDYHLERSWIGFDRYLLHEAGVQGAIESLGPVLPGLLELSYLLVYAIGPASIGVLYFYSKHRDTDRFLLIYLLGALCSYAMFPYFTSDPPRVVFPGADMPQVTTVLRQINLWLCGNYGIHSSVFPSAHVSSAFSAAFGIMTVLPRHRRLIAAFLIYAILVAIATFYGRYHYAVDAIAGTAVSIVTYAAYRAVMARGAATVSAEEEVERVG